MMATMTLYARPGSIKKKRPAKKAARKTARKSNPGRKTGYRVEYPGGVLIGHSTTLAGARGQARSDQKFRGSAVQIRSNRTGAVVEKFSATVAPRKNPQKRAVKRTKNPVSAPVVILAGAPIAKFRSILRAREYAQALANKTGKQVQIKI